MPGRINIYAFSIYRVLELTFAEDAGKETEEEKKEEGPNPSTGQPVNDPGTAAGGPAEPGTGDAAKKEEDPNAGKKGMKPDDEVQFYYKEADHTMALPWNWKDVGTLTSMNAPIPTWVQSKTLYTNNAPQLGYYYVLLQPTDDAGEAVSSEGKEVVFAYISGSFGSGAPSMSCGPKSWTIGAPYFDEDDKNYYDKFTELPTEGIVSPGFKLKMIADTKNRPVRIEWVSPLIFIYETSRLFSINMAAMYDQVTKMTHLFTTHAGNCGGEYSGADGITIQQQIIDDDSWEQRHVPIPRSVLNSYLIGDAPLRTEGGYCLGPMPEPASIPLVKDDSTTQQKGGTGSQYYDAAASYNFLATKIIVKNTVSGKDLNEAFKSWAGGVAEAEPCSFRLANYTSSFEAMDGYDQSFGGEDIEEPAAPEEPEEPGGEEPEEPSPEEPSPEEPSPEEPDPEEPDPEEPDPEEPDPEEPDEPDEEEPKDEYADTGYGGGLPYDGSYFEQLMTPPGQFASTGRHFIPFIASNSNVKVFPPSSPLKKIIAPGEPIAFGGVWRGTLYRAAFPTESKIEVPKGTSVQKRKYVSSLDLAQQMDYQDQCEGNYYYPYYASSPTAVCDDKGNHYLGVETSTGSAQSAGRVDLAYSRGLQGEFSIIRDISTRLVTPPTKEELEADAKRKEDDPDAYDEINDPDPAPLPAVLPRLLVDNALPYLYVFFVYKSYIWCKIIPIEFLHNLVRAGELSLEDELTTSHKIRAYLTVKVTSFYFYATAYSSSPGDYSVFQDRHGDIYVALEDNYPVEPTVKNYQTYPYMEQSSTLKIAKSVNGGMNWTSVLPKDFSWFVKRKRKTMCISGFSSECDDIYVHCGPRNMECLYDPDTHILNLFFMMYGCILYSRIPMEVLQLGNETKISDALKRNPPYIIYGSLSPSIDVMGSILSMEEVQTDACVRGITVSADVTRRGRSDSGLMISHRRGAVRTSRGNYRLFFIDERYRYTSLISFDCGSTWYTEKEVLYIRA